MKCFGVLAACVLLACACYGDTFTFTGVLTGANEFPANASPATGFATVSYDSSSHLLDVAVTFSGLLGTTTASHIHCCVAPDAVTPTAGVATTVPSFTGFPLGVTSGSYSHVFDLTLASSFNPSFITAHGGTPAGAEAFLISGLEDGMAYFNIHTNVFPGGEIRVFLQPVPEPASALLLGSALGGAWLKRMRRKKTS